MSSKMPVYVAALERGQSGAYNITDDDPAPVSEWLPYLAEAVGDGLGADQSADPAFAAGGDQATHDIAHDLGGIGCLVASRAQSARHRQAYLLHNVGFVLIDASQCFDDGPPYRLSIVERLLLLSLGRHVGFRLLDLLHLGFLQQRPSPCAQLRSPG